MFFRILKAFVTNSNTGLWQAASFVHLNIWLAVTPEEVIRKISQNTNLQHSSLPWEGIAITKRNNGTHSPSTGAVATILHSSWQLTVTFNLFPPASSKKLQDLEEERKSVCS